MPNKKQSMNKKQMKTAGILPLGDRVLVRPFTEEEVKGEKGNKHYGIILPDNLSKEKSAQGKVLAIGEGKYVDGKLMPVRVKVGDVVLFSKYGYDEVEHNGEELYLLKEDNLLAVIKK
jgi:chaperonin GroES